ncbi:hypothetical protein V8B97DRAFT_1943779 [Scleroderma yunnanense]
MSSRRGPPSTAPPAYRYVTRVYKRSLRPVVLATAIVSALWCLFLYVGGAGELVDDQNQHFPKLAPLAIVQLVLYIVALLFQVFGIAASSTQRVRCIRLYSYLCALSVLFATGVGFMRVVTHFTFKNDLIAECEVIVQNGTSDSLFGFWGPDSVSNLTPSEASSYCNDLWNRNSWAEILLTLLVICLGLLFTAIAFAYYRQAIDPTSPVNSSRAPSNQVRMNEFPAYNPPYDAPVYAPPPGPPPFDADGKPPQYQYGDYTSYKGDKGKDDKEDPFGDHGLTPPMPTHWAEERDVTSSRA